MYCFAEQLSVYWFAEQLEFLSVFLLFNRVTSEVSRRVPPTLRPQHLEFKYFARHLQYLQQNSDGSFSKIAVFTGHHRGGSQDTT